MITRHFIDIGTGKNRRRVHYRRAGSGPLLLMVHQSPRSSKEYEALMMQWGRHFTCIAPDTPGFGQSDPLSGHPEIDDFADALVELLDALGIDKCAAYGFHSGGIILVTALKRHPNRLSTLAIGGYAIWSVEEMRIFGEEYLPEFHPSPYGEHLTWLWNRILEQSWFFPWFAVDDDHRLSVANDDPLRVDAVVREMLDAGNAYQAGYGAVLRAPRDIPSLNSGGPPCLISAYDGDPLQDHIDRLGDLPPNWSARKVATPQDHQQASLDHLLATAGQDEPELPQNDDAGFIAVDTAGFSGLLHWKGRRNAKQLLLAAPGRDISLINDPDVLALDLPGHGLSDDWDDPSAKVKDWVTVISTALDELNLEQLEIIGGEGASFLLACHVAGQLQKSAAGINVHLPQPEDNESWLNQSLPDLSPDRHGAYLTRCWDIARASHLFFPWFDCRPETAIPFDPGEIAPDQLAREHLALFNARSGRHLLRLLLLLDRGAALAAAPHIISLDVARWAAARDDVWTPPSPEH